MNNWFNFLSVGLASIYGVGSIHIARRIKSRIWAIEALLGCLDKARPELRNELKITIAKWS